MVHTLYIDDTTLKSKRLIKALKKETAIVRFDDPFLSEQTPEGYLTVEEFRIAAKNSARQILKDRGIL